MNPIVAYAFQTVICSGVFYLLYRTLVENRTSFLFCRIYLVVTAMAAAVIPALKIPVYAGDIIEIPLLVLTAAAPEATVPEVQAAVESASNPPFYPILVYAGISILFLAVLVYRLVRIERYKKGARRSSNGGISIYESERILTPFSFLRNIFLPATLPVHARDQIIAHESGHVAHNHSIEILVMETLKVFSWFNPFVWLGRRSLTQVHEYEADNAVITNGHDADDYKNLLFTQLFGYSPDISNGFACTGTKKRFLMMNKNKPGPRSIFRVLAAVPLAAGLLAVFSFTDKAASIVYTSADGSQTDDIHSVIEELLLSTATEHDVTDPAAFTRTSAIQPAADNPGQAATGNTDSITKAIQDALEEIRKINMDSLQMVVQDATASIEQARQTIQAHRHLIDSIRRYLPEEEAMRVLAVMQNEKNALLGLSRQAGLSEPLVILDGVKQGRIDMSTIDTGTIESVSILKGKSGTEIYGSEGANGVVLITTKGASTNPEDDEEPFIVVENMPQFQDGDVKDFRNWVIEELKPFAEGKSISGRSIATFVVNKQGKVIKPVILDSLGSEVDEEIKRILLSSPLWTPGTQRGHMVNVRLNLPVDF